MRGQALVAGGRRFHRVAFQLQQGLQRFANRSFVVDDQHRPADEDAASFTSGAEWLPASDIDSLPRQREIQIERSALARLALDSNLARMFLNNAVGNRQAEARAFALSLARRGLGGKERIVNALDVFLGDARAGIGHDHAHSVAVGSVRPARSPPLGMASLAFRNRFRNTCCNRPGLPLISRQVFGQIVLHFDLGDLELVFEQRQRIRR